MATRSLVGGRYFGELRVTYVHNDGYPSHMMPELVEMVRRDGAQKVLDTILNNRGGGWSGIERNATREGIENDGRGEPKFDHVPGYGRRYADADGEPGMWVLDDTILRGSSAEYLYLINAEPTTAIDACAMPRSLSDMAMKVKRYAVHGDQRMDDFIESLS